MTGMDILTRKVKDGITHHNMTCSGACSSCPYKDSSGTCIRKILNDANEVIDYWKGKYESTILDTQPMILNLNQGPSIIKVDASDINKTLKYSKALQKMADSGKQASEALRDVTEALKDLKDVFPDESPKITEIAIAKCTNCGVHYDASHSSVCPNCTLRRCER